MLWKGFEPRSSQSIVWCSNCALCRIKKEKQSFSLRAFFSESFWSKLSLRKSKMGSKGRNSSKTWFPINLGPVKNRNKTEIGRKKMFRISCCPFFSKRSLPTFKKIYWRTKQLNFFWSNRDSVVRPLMSRELPKLSNLKKIWVPSDSSQHEK